MNQLKLERQLKLAEKHGFNDYIIFGLIDLIDDCQAFSDVWHGDLSPTCTDDFGNVVNHICDNPYRSGVRLLDLLIAPNQ